MLGHQSHDGLVGVEAGLFPDHKDDRAKEDRGNDGGVGESAFGNQSRPGIVEHENWFHNIWSRHEDRHVECQRIRARGAQVSDWLAKERPDVFCLQEIKASERSNPDVDPRLRRLRVSLAWRKGLFRGRHAGAVRFSDARPDFSHPHYDYETRVVTARVADIVIASIYVPNGGKDFDAKMRFLEDLVNEAARCERDGTSLVLCGDLNVARTEIDVHPKERKPLAIGQRSEERALLERVIAHGLVDVGRAQDPDNHGLFTWWAPWRNMRNGTSAGAWITSCEPGPRGSRATAVSTPRSARAITRGGR